MKEKSLRDLDLNKLIQQKKKFFTSPFAWEDQVMYFLMLVRFSDGNETGYLDLNGKMVSNGTTPLFQPGEAEIAVQSEVDAARWREAGGHWVGGNLKGWLYNSACPRLG